MSPESVPNFTTPLNPMYHEEANGPSSIPLTIYDVYKQYHRWVIAWFVKPEVQRRLTVLSANKFDTEKATEALQSTENCLQWLIDAALKSRRPFNRDPYIITQRLFILQFVTMYPISGSSTDALYDLISQPNSESIINIIRQNVNEVLAMNDNTWTKRAVSQLISLDSAFRESLRLAPVVAFGSGRYVGVKGGLTTPVSQTYLPEGSTVAIPSVAIHEARPIMTSQPNTMPSGSVKG
ncbi:hypothetical protein H2198_003436 [Neophaeococcomyces mojaviensis]|uniref:Uncharacterized protein n=1 Tax=Neophaeococcomyces mojaviensis TaxID=3383035 RepID=A0ACC3ABA0_9EURO|nr:hypothetical protein H2198_003436 [Knufia sp. JES_112]